MSPHLSRLAALGLMGHHLYSLMFLHLDAMLINVFFFLNGLRRLGKGKEDWVSVFGSWLVCIRPICTFSTV